MTGTKEKTTFDLATDLKQGIVELKKEMHISLNAILNEAVADYLKKQELKKWEKAATLASKNQDYLKLCKELGSSGGEIYAD